MTKNTLEGPTNAPGSWSMSFSSYCGQVLAFIDGEHAEYAADTFDNSIDTVQADMDAGYTPSQCAQRFIRAAEAMADKAPSFGM